MISVLYVLKLQLKVLLFLYLSVRFFLLLFSPRKILLILVLSLLMIVDLNFLREGAAAIFLFGAFSSEQNVATSLLWELRIYDNWDYVV
jgi:hypothetical protein